MTKLLWISLCFITVGFAQDSISIQQIQLFQEKLNKKFSSEDISPLTPEDRSEFRGLDFFEINTDFRIKAKFIRTPYETPFIMKTTSGAEPLYVKYGEVHFSLLNHSYVLAIYQNQGLIAQPAYKDYLFLPFTDKTNGESSYAGGRFIDLRIPEGKDIWIDFNTAYNPYCAYNAHYSCPIPPEENHLPVAIPVGVRYTAN